MVIGSLVTNIVADLSKWGPNLTKARKDLNATNKAITGALAGLGGAFAAAFSVKALKGVADDMDRISKASDRLGVATESLVGLEHAANLSGVSIGNVGAALNRVNKLMANARMGDASSMGAFQRIGMDISELGGMSADKVLGQIADGLNAIPGASERAAAAAELFGNRLGPQLQDLLKDGSAGLAKMQSDAKSLGLTFNSIEGKAIEEANDALTRAGESIKGLARQLVTVLGPAVGKATSAVADLLKDEVKLVTGGFKKEMAADNRTAREKRVSMLASGATSKQLTELLGNKSIDLEQRAEIGEARGRIWARDKQAKIEADAKSEANKVKSAKTILEAPSRAFGSLWDKAGQIGGDGASALGGLLTKGKELEKSAFAATTAQMFGFGPFDASKMGGAMQPKDQQKSFGITPGFSLAQSGSAESYRQRRAIERQGAPGDVKQVAKNHLAESKKQTTLLEKLVKKNNEPVGLAAADFAG